MRPQPAYKSGVIKNPGLLGWPAALMLTFGLAALTLPARFALAEDAAPPHPLVETQAEPARTNQEKTATLKDLCLDPKTFIGKTVVVAGQVQRNPEAEKLFGKNSFVLFRRWITCCEDDAKTVGVIVAGPGQAWENKTWLQVRGTFTIRETNRGSTLVIQNATLEKIEAPKSKFLR